MACFLEATALCVFGDKSRWEKTKSAKSLKISGVGKFSFLSIGKEDCIFNFESVFVGKSVSKTFTLQNPSLVKNDFLLKHRLKLNFQLKVLNWNRNRILNFQRILELFRLIQS